MQSPSCKIDIGHLEGTKNWATWKFKATLLLRGMPGALDAINGNLEKPVKPTTNNAEEISEYQKALDKYNHIDSSALLLLTANMSDETLQKIMRFNSSKDVWDELHRLFDGTSEDKSYALCMEFFSYRKDPSHDITTHISKIKTLWSDLKLELVKTEKCELPNILLICKILDTLPDNYFSFKSSWMLISKTDRTIENLTTQLCAYERSISLKHENPTEALIVHSSSNKNKYKKKCGYCGKVGHKVRQCQKWKADGKPSKPESKQTSSNSNFNLMLMQATTTPEVYSLRSNDDTTSWYVDNGATSHVSCRKDYFASFQHFEDARTLTVANGTAVKAIGKGTVNLKVFICGKESEITLCDVWYVPDIMRNLFSVLAAQDRLHNSVFISEREHCSLKVDGKIRLTGKRVKYGGLYKLNVETIRKSTPDLNVVSSNNLLQLYHERLAHQNKKHVKEVIEKELGIKVRLDSELCTGCIYGKTHRKKFGTRERAKAPAEIIHADVCGPFPPSFNKFRYFVLFKDDYSKYRHVYLMRHKSEVHLKLRQMLQECKVAGYSVKEFLSDNGGEFDNENVRRILSEAGIRQRLTMPYTPQQNGVSERENRTLVEAARTMMHSHQELPVATWAELINTVTYILNRTGPTLENGKSPFELWFKKKPSIKHLKVIGCECYAHVPQQKRTKMSKKAEKCILIGYDGDEGYRLLNKHGKLVRSRDVIFNETILESTGLDDDEEYPSIEINIPLTTPPMCNAREDNCTESETVTANNQHDQSQTMPSTSLGLDVSQDEESRHPTEVLEPSSTETPSMPSPSEAFDDNDDDNVDELQNLDESLEITPRMTLRDRSQLRPPTRFDDYVMVSAEVINGINEPKTYTEAMTSPQKDQWVKAMESEVKSLKENKTWMLVDLPKDRKPISCKWVYKIKTNADGSLDKFKARLVARGYTQKKGIDYDETFSPVAKMTTIRSVLSVAANEGLKLTQFDVSTAFLYGSLDEEIYMKQPEGYTDGSNKVCRLKRSLYGLKQAPRCWNKCMVDYLKTIGFKQCNTDPCLFIRKRGNNKIVLALYVDDGLIAYTNQKDSDKFITELKRRFKITVKDASYFLGLEIKISDENIKVSQKHYAQKLLDRFEMSDCKPVSTPMQKDGIADCDKEQNSITYPYREAVGALTYLAVGTRPDLSYAVSVVSRTLEAPSKEDLHKLKRILRYIKGTLDYGIVYKRNFNAGILDCYSDSDHGGDNTTGRSTSGILCLYSGGAVSWLSRRQTCVAISSTEAELVAASEAAREIVWIKRLFGEISNLKEVPNLRVDNDAAIKISHNPELHRRTKHIALRHFYVRELVTEGEIRVEYVPSEFQLADLLTKALHKPRIVSIATHIGLIQ